MLQPLLRSFIAFRGLALWWRKDISVTVLEETESFIDTKITDQEGNSWFATFVYGSPHPAGKAEVWRRLSALRSQPDSPWCCLGDFNDIRELADKIGGSGLDDNRVNRFNELIAECVHGNSGPRGQFTWTNNQCDQDFIAQKIDRILANAEWSFLFPHGNGVVECTIELDHKPIVLKLEKKTKPKKEAIQFGNEAARSSYLELVCH